MGTAEQTSAGTETGTVAGTVATATVTRPQRADARRNFDALLAAARDGFAANGTSASLEEIARQAGVGIGTLYRNFPTRDALVEAVYVDEVESVVRAASEAASLEPWDAFDTWLHRFITYVGTKKALVDGLNKDSPVLLTCRTSLYSAGEPLLKRAQAAGVVREDTEIGDVVRMISGIASVAFDDDAQRDRVIDLAVDGLRPVRR
ncbi:TetR/AcrR family transcriptional regulator [Leifsonia poae]|uniref:TetR family transcriptional regulator n=1 Tax=Leifsonia poae TaxID=110933 RepID=A0A9W6H8H8_9MICO|nr:TetR/AcrR family transcriptional regulator [Leifsonia poae]GLJ75218.1 TetR family transcriptional regulator [Leifsonia poae]